MAAFWIFSTQIRRSDHFSPLNRNEMNVGRKNHFGQRMQHADCHPSPFSGLFSPPFWTPRPCVECHILTPKKKKNWKHKIGNKKVSATLRLHLVFKYSPLRKYKVPPTLRIVTSINHRSVCMCVCASFWLVTQNAADDHHHHHHRSITSPTLYIYCTTHIPYAGFFGGESSAACHSLPIPRFLDSLTPWQ